MSVAIPWSVDVPCVNGVHLVSPPSPFEDRYAAVRAQERRILTDEEVHRLPDGRGLWNAAEWKVRARSAERLLDDLVRHNGPRQYVLEVGCGNGWLCGLLHRAGHSVIGIDPFTAELEQAARVFDGPLFARADLFTAPLPEQGFNAVIFAASIQYFPDPAAAVRRALELTVAGGGVHVLDTVLYRTADEAAAAQERSHAYYSGSGFPEMAAHYHAHQEQVFRTGGRTKVLAKPSVWKRLRGDRSPFTHLVITR